jgi:hypothetical protein
LTANGAAPTAIATFLDCPAAKVTLDVASCETAAAGPPRASVKVSETLPRLRTVNWNVAPGVTVAGERLSETPCVVTFKVPVAAPVICELDYEVAVTVKFTGPGVVPCGAVMVSVVCRKLPSPGGTVMLFDPNDVVNPAGALTLSV